MTTVNWQPVKDYSEIIFERAGKIAKITMNRPEKMNAFTLLKYRLQFRINA